MIGVRERLVTGIAFLLLALGCLGAVGAAEAQELEVRVSFDSIAAGQSVVGAGVVHPLLTIGDSGGNDVLAIQEGRSPAAYSAPFGQNIANSATQYSRVPDPISSRLSRLLPLLVGPRERR